MNPAKIAMVGCWLLLAAGVSWAAPPEKSADEPLWNIAWITDTQTPQCEWITAMIAPVKANKPSMIIHTGDARFEWANRCAWKDVLDLMRIASPPIELHLAPGNHDDEAEHVLRTSLLRAAVEGVYPLATDETRRGPIRCDEMVTREVTGPEYPVWNPEIVRDANWRPGHKPPYRYVFYRGGIRFIVCDVYWSPEQQAWLRDLITKPDESSVSIVLQHEHIVDGRNENYFRGLEGRHNVKLMLTGHDHHYRQEQRHGVTFITGAGMAEGQYRDSDAMTLWVYRDHLRLDRYVIDAGVPRPAVRGPETIWTCPGEFSAYRRPATAPSTRPTAQPGPNRFVILSDLHPHPSAYEQVDRVVDQVVAVRPAFAIVLGDIGGDAPESSTREIETLRAGFRRLREAGIEVYPVMGNHDVHPRVEGPKVAWLCGQEPLPLNPLFDARRGGEARQRFLAHGPYDYSFNRGGIHFAIVDSNVLPPKDNVDPARKALAQQRWETHQRWMIDDLCKHANNPQRFPTLVFLHHPEYASGDRGMQARPLYRVLAECADSHTVKAVFGGHYHYGQVWPPEANAGAYVYATPPTVHSDSRPIEFIVAEVRDDAVTFVPCDSLTGRPRTAAAPVAYRPLDGRFGSLRSPAPAPASQPPRSCSLPEIARRIAKLAVKLAAAVGCERSVLENGRYSR